MKISLLFLILLIAFLGCSKSNTSTNNSSNQSLIVGKWTLVSDSIYYAGTYQTSDIYDTSTNYNGKYQVYTSNGQDTVYYWDGSIYHVDSAPYTVSGNNLYDAGDTSLIRSLSSHQLSLKVISVNAGTTGTVQNYVK